MAKSDFGLKCRFLPDIGPRPNRLPVLRTSRVRLYGRGSELMSSFRLARERQSVGLVSRDAVAIAQSQ